MSEQLPPTLQKYVNHMAAVGQPMEFAEIVSVTPNYNGFRHLRGSDLIENTVPGYKPDEAWTGPRTPKYVLTDVGRSFVSGNNTNQEQAMNDDKEFDAWLDKYDSNADWSTEQARCAGIAWLAARVGMVPGSQVEELCAAVGESCGWVDQGMGHGHYKIGDQEKFAVVAKQVKALAASLTPTAKPELEGA